VVGYRGSDIGDRGSGIGDRKIRAAQVSGNPDFRRHDLVPACPTQSGGLIVATVAFGKVPQQPLERLRELAHLPGRSVIHSAVIQRCVAVRQHIAESHDEGAIRNPRKKRWVELAQLSEGIAGDLKLALDR
jgi:hypothetical protein